jgi:hypothetical protein
MHAQLAETLQDAQLADIPPSIGVLAGATCAKSAASSWKLIDLAPPARAATSGTGARGRGGPAARELRMGRLAQALLRSLLHAQARAQPAGRTARERLVEHLGQHGHDRRQVGACASRRPRIAHTRCQS